MPLTPELLAAIPGIVAQLATILAGISALIARRFITHPVRVTYTIPLCNYIGRTTRRLARLASRLAAGTQRIHAPRPGRKGGARKPCGFPTTHAWLRATLVQEANVYGSQLTHLLEQPDTTALLAAAPAAARLLRPICHMLGVSPVPLRPPPRPAKPPKAARPPATPGPATPEPAKPAPSRHRREPFVFRPRPPEPLCPRLVGRWPFAPYRPPRPA